MSIRMDCRLVWLSRCLLAIVVLFLAGAERANAQASCTGVSNDPQGAVTWVPLWCEEFNATTAGPPDTAVWSFDLGNSGFGNSELETYCGPPGYSGNPSNCPATFSTSTSNAYLDGGGSNGHLVIQAINNGGTWFSGRMKTQGLQNFQYGRIEASIKLPDTTNQGLWPAFWSLGSDINTTPWPACGEVDFMEDWSPQVFNGPGPLGNKTTIHTSVTGGNGVGGLFTFPNGQQADTNFHTYGTIWSANMMQFYVDDPTKPFLIETPGNLPSGDTWPFNAQLFLLANIAVGGTLGGTPSGLTPNPGIMSLDYVRQYQPLAAVSAPVMGTPPSITVKAGATTGNSSTFTPGLTAGTGYVYFSCSTNAPKASCAISTSDFLNPYVANSNASPADTVTVTVTTTANTAAASATTANAIPPSFFNFPLSSFNLKTRIWLPGAFGGLLLWTFVVAAGRTRIRAYLYGSMLVIGLLVTGAASCGGGSNNTQVVPPGNNGTPPGSYTVSVYAFTESNISSGSNSNADASVATPLTVN
ncbi:MAG TPA: glycoside hydrolase family 16 protein [Candidatus Acidoferrum sp.]|nr:glycoside hydrolase family 16 protein [Candidatus Acidoferrum sp.]